ncbi:cupredoxin domain-containing protein [Aliiglaciecola sp. CAU 1673]|uniref:cupredoxin domain-containing protein n=1 Tax=Aliiglaciecola sp. CAU 1673 TaxID=3032595 RepID=UPI0023DB61D8|nr:cupredoxin domain-containing protein [Aliiglaciecola sp. CAU 1673]MDF2179885.1 cupredoxin domain-containing protein [Aliiglaciecola sp. CAU 1673]
MMLVNLLGLALIGLIIWWFWLYKAESQPVSDGQVKILVKDGSYQPAKLTLKAGTPITLVFQREDASPCAELVVFPSLELSETLPLGKSVRIQLPRLDKGNYPFHCQMQMYRGEITVV